MSASSSKEGFCGVEVDRAQRGVCGCLHCDSERVSVSILLSMEPMMKILLLVAVIAMILPSVAARGLLSSAEDDPASAAKAFHYKPFRPYWKNNNAAAKTAAADSLFGSSKAFEGSSEYVKLKYHMGPVLSQQMHIYIVWYGKWKSTDKSIIRDFLNSVSPLSSSSSPHSSKDQHQQQQQQQAAEPSVKKWWSTVRLYTDQTLQNITNEVVIAGEHDLDYIHGHSLTRLTMQQVLKSALAENNGTLPVNPRKGIYLLLTAGDVVVQDFCRAVCGFHYFSFPSIVGYTLPYAWVGHSEKQCPEVCAYPFVVPSYMAHTRPMVAPNASPAVDGMVSVIAHELAEISSNPLINAWYAGEDPTAPTEIADLCEGMYGTGAGGGYAGSVLTDPRTGGNYNMVGINMRKFLVQWIWSPVLNACSGPNASD